MSDPKKRYCYISQDIFEYFSAGVAFRSLIRTSKTSCNILKIEQGLSDKAGVFFRIGLYKSMTSENVFRVLEVQWRN